MHDIDREFLINHGLVEEADYKLLKELFTNNKRIKEFIHAFTEMQRAATEHRETAITISIGETTKDGFFFYLNSSVKNPRILFTSWNEDNQSIPQIIISGRAYTVMCFSLDDVKIISCKIENDDCTCSFDRYNFVVHIGKFDYDMTMIVYKR